MRYCYNKLWKLLIDREMKKKDLEEKAEIASSTIAKMGNEQPVSLNVLAKICKLLDVQIGDILDIFFDEVK